ncbi:hypothetical protein AB0E06_23485 [Streptomyces sp. NPDC048109]|uniref:hypothetical protein n=1 Tax=unclassified Streptomyces TaxID=2593676 RepID=UPI0033C2CDF4
MSVVGYTYLEDNLCPSCTIGRMRANGIKVAKGMDHEEAIHRAAERVGVDFSDEGSYVSGDFPKAITSQQACTELTELPDGERGEIRDERCDRCGKWMVLGEKSPTEAGLTRWARDTYELPQALARDVARQSREWGLSHPEFITEDNVRQAAVLFPHDYTTVHLPGQSSLGLMTTPSCDGAPCFYCEQPWEKHMFVCGTCGADVPADIKHSHPIPVKGQIKFPEVKANA